MTHSCGIDFIGNKRSMSVDLEDGKLVCTLKTNTKYPSRIKFPVLKCPVCGLDAAGLPPEPKEGTRADADGQQIEPQDTNTPDPASSPFDGASIERL